MSKPTLEPVHVPGRNLPWRLSIAATLSPDGRRKQLFFAKKGEAEQYADTIRFQTKKFGDNLRQIDEHDLSEAVRALELLRPHGIGLLEAVKGYLDYRQYRATSVTFGAAWDVYLGLRKHSLKYTQELRQVKDKVKHLLDRPLCDLTEKDLEHSLSTAPHARNAQIRRLRSVIGLAVRKGWLSANVAHRLDLKHSKADEVKLYSVEQVKAMLQWAMDNDRDLVPFIAIGAFCGLRPDNELANLRWSDVHIHNEERPQIVIRPETSKTRSRRFVDISANCVQWIDEALFGIPATGRVAPFSKSTLRRKRRKLHVKTGIEVIQDGLRHTYASAWLTAHKSSDELALQMGHRSPGMLYRHYYRAMSAGDAEKYWAIVPRHVALSDNA